jgi:hypothetical protein
VRAVTPSPYPGSIDHYAQAFSLLSERCFRFIHHEAGHAQHGPYITEWRGRFKVGAVKWHAVEAFDGHRADLGRSSG